MLIGNDVEEMDNMLDELDRQLTDDEKDMLEDLLVEYKGQEFELLQDLMEYTYRWEPVPVKEFINSDEYLGLEGEIYPKIQDDLTELFNGDYIEAILCGSIGWGKSTFAELAMTRMIYEISCLRNPHKVFGLMKGSVIAFINVSINKKSAKEVVFQGIKSKIDQSPYFNEVFPPDKKKVEQMQFPNKVWIFPIASGESGILGYNVFGGVMDEVNFMPTVDESKKSHGNKSYDHAETLYNALIRRMKNRFMRRGKLPGILIQVSSSRYPDDYTERRLREVKEFGLEDVFVRRYAQWDTLPPDKFRDEWFKVAIGNEVQKSKILETEEEEKFAEEEGMQIIKVPEDFRSDFLQDIDGAIRDLAGLPTLTISPFIPDRAKVMEAMEKGSQLEPELEHGFTKEVTTLEDGATFDTSKLRLTQLRSKISEIEEKIDKGKALNREKLKLEQLRNKYNSLRLKKRFIHIDLALTNDSAGFAMGYVDGKKEVVRENSEGNEYSVSLPEIVIEFMLEIQAPTNGEIQLADVRSLVFELRSLGYKIELVSYDQYQSKESQQQLKRKGIESTQLSISGEVYAELKNALYEGRLITYYHEKAHNEIVSLEKNQKTGKVDHPPGGSNDIADCVAGVCFHAMNQEMKEPAHAPVPGILED